MCDTTTKARKVGVDSSFNQVNLKEYVSTAILSFATVIDVPSGKNISSAIRYQSIHGSAPVYGPGVRNHC